MTTLLEFREKLKLFYARAEIYTTPLWKFLLAFLAFFMINLNVGFMARLKSPTIALVLAMVCCLLPVNMIAVFGGILILAHAYALSLEAFGVATVLILIMLLLYFRMAPGYGYLLVAVPITFAFKIPYVLPLVMGLVGTPVTAIPVACGTVVYYLLHYMKLNTAMLSESGTETMQQKLLNLFENVVNNKEMLLLIVAFSLTILLVYVIRKMSVDYAWYAAIIMGAITEFLVVLVGNLMLQTTIGILSLILGSLVAMGVAMVLQFFLFSVDYSRTEYVQFEDDEYYYYVKAVPKITIAVSDKKVKKINTQRKSQPRTPSRSQPKMSAKMQPPHRTTGSGKSGSRN
ncbi:MAG: hypothetical protein HFI33_10165 [Lachnospiraceae bacterium]|nr:hypothetical protein [Lachnospiraceae bacterium]